MRRFIRLITAVCIGMGSALWPQPVLPHDTDSTTTIVFDREVVRILSHHCVSCHSDRNLAVPLTTYDETYIRARTIKTEVQERHMPPWSAMPGYGHFSNDNGLTAREIEFLVSWADGGKTRSAGTVFLNVPGSATIVRRDVRAEEEFGWEVPDLSFTRRLAPQSVPAHEPLVRRVTVELGLPGERWVKALEYLPGDRRVVRSAIFTVEQTGQWLGSWTPWAHAMKLPSRMAYRLPTGARIVAEIHYKGTADEVVDEGTLGLSFGEKPARATCDGDLTLVTAADPLAGAEERIFRSETTIAEDMWVLALRPDIAAGVRSVQVSAKTPNGGIDVLLFARDIRHDWPTPYIFREPVQLRRGTRLSVVMHSAIDNSAPPAIQRLIVSRCAEAPSPTASVRTSGGRYAEQAGRKVYPFRGKVEKVDTKAKTLSVNGENVEGWMAAMTMTYGVDKEDVISHLKIGDEITAKVYDGDFKTLYDVRVMPPKSKATPSQK